MLIVQTKIFINQLPTVDFPNRGYQFMLDFVCEFEANNGWEDLTDQGKITLPKHFAYTDTTKTILINPANITGAGSNIGGFSSNIPLFLRGDEVTLMAGYKYNSNGQEITDMAIYFDGFISKVSSKKPFTLDIEDNMWKLKQAPAKGGVNGVFAHSKYNVEMMLNELMKNAGLIYTVNDLTKTDLGIDFRINNETIGQIMERLRKDYYLKSYFRGNELRTGSQIYIESEANTLNFNFQQNIIEDDLEYQRQDDLVLSAIAKSTYIVATGEITTDGHAKTKTKKLEVLITFQNGKFTSLIKQNGAKDFPTNNNGERHEFLYNGITDPQKLIAEAKRQLQVYYYTGFKGNFTTFGTPFVRMGDNVKLIDNILPERNGTYKVKKVDYKLSVNGGLRQIIHLDFKLNIS